jgi:UDP-N-acetylmuramyl pentapeptide phosphotransferase/UDP-N-acetylglucosamine-1-phosphate transferase
MGSAGAAAVALAVFAATLLLTGRLKDWLAARALLDRPVERSSHRVPVPRGGGLVLVPALIAGWLLIWARGGAPQGTLAIAAAAAVLAIVSWRDDVGGLPVPLRLGVHAAAVLAGLAFLPPTFAGALPFWLDRVVAGLLWLWFVELYNFMDGIDGIAGVETVMLGAGIALVLAGGGDAALALAAAAAAAGFVWWNWHPARIFLGDVGSVPLGYLLGWLLLRMAAQGLWAAALILPLYYLADATITLGLRLARRAPVWQAHREHFYQRAVRSDGNHAAVVRIIAMGDGALVLLALFAAAHPAPALLLAAAATGFLLWLLARRASGA